MNGTSFSLRRFISGIYGQRGIGVAVNRIQSLDLNIISTFVFFFLLQNKLNNKIWSVLWEKLREIEFFNGNN